MKPKEMGEGTEARDRFIWTMKALFQVSKAEIVAQEKADKPKPKRKAAV